MHLPKGKENVTLLGQVKAAHVECVETMNIKFCCQDIRPRPARGEDIIPATWSYQREIHKSSRQSEKSTHNVYI